MDQRIGNRMGVAACNVESGTQKSNMNGGTSTRDEYDDSDYGDVTAMRSRLATINGTVYTTAVLDAMTYNDMVYAIRLNDSPDTIKDT